MSDLSRVEQLLRNALGESAPEIAELIKRLIDELILRLMQMS